jgi:hypothetical protein
MQYNQCTINQQVVLSCVTPRYAVSDSCCKELSLSDLLHKPIIPVMMDKTPWPPPGAMGVILAQLIYVDLAGCGGHGGCGRGADWSEKVQDLSSRLLSYASAGSSSGVDHRHIRSSAAAMKRTIIKQGAADVGEVVADVGNRALNVQEDVLGEGGGVEDPLDQNEEGDSMSRSENVGGGAEALAAENETEVDSDSPGALFTCCNRVRCCGGGGSSTCKIM